MNLKLGDKTHGHETTE